MAGASYLGAVGGRPGSYSIVFMDLNGLSSCGDTLEEVLAMGKDALEGYLAVARDYGDPIPAPTAHTIEDVDRWFHDDADDIDEREPWIGLFPVTAEEERGEVTVSIPRALVRDLDDTIPDARRFIIDATRRELDRLKKSA